MRSRPARKDITCQYTDRIRVGIVSDSPEVQQAARAFADYIKAETLATELGSGTLDGIEPIELKVGEHSVQLYVQVVGSTKI